MKRFLIVLVPAVALLLGGQARATPMTPDTVQWTYNWEPGAPALFADTNPSASVSFTDEPQKAAKGSSDVVATNLRTASVAPGDVPDILNKNGAYSLTLILTSTDAQGVHTATLVFHGALKGTFSAENSNLTNMWGADFKQTVSMGSFNFTVTMNAYTPPGPPDQKNFGSIGAHVTITNLMPANVPEPSTMLLSGLGMTLLGVGAWRKRRAKGRAALAA